MAGLEDQDEERLTMQQLRAAVKEAIGTSSIEAAALAADVAPNTILRVLRGQNVTIRTAARLCARLRAPLEIKLAHKNRKISR